MQGSNNQFWEVMSVYIEAARIAGKLVTASALATTVGMAVIQLTLADPQWSKQCALDAWHLAGYSDMEYEKALYEAKELIQTIQSRQLDSNDAIDIAAARIRKAGLN